MKYYAITGTFVEPCPISEKELMEKIGEHLSYLDIGFKDGSILVSGPKAEGGGGVIIKKAESLTELKAFIQNDPLSIVGAQTYTFVEFKMNDCQPEVRAWFEDAK